MGFCWPGIRFSERISPNIGAWAYTYPNPLRHYFESLEKTAALRGQGTTTPSETLPDGWRAHHLERLEYLLAEGQVKRLELDGIIYYSR